MADRHRHPEVAATPIRGAFGPWLRALGDCERCAQLRSLAALAAVFVGSANPLVTTLPRAGARRAAVQHPCAARGGIRGRATRTGAARRRHVPFETRSGAAVMARAPTNFRQASP